MDTVKQEHQTFRRLFLRHFGRRSIPFNHFRKNKMPMGKTRSSTLTFHDLLQSTRNSHTAMTINSLLFSGATRQLHVQRHPPRHAHSEVNHCIVVQTRKIRNRNPRIVRISSFLPQICFEHMGEATDTM